MICLEKANRGKSIFRDSRYIVSKLTIDLFIVKYRLEITQFYSGFLRVFSIDLGDNHCYKTIVFVTVHNTFILIPYLSSTKIILTRKMVFLPNYG